MRERPVRKNELLLAVGNQLQAVAARVRHPLRGPSQWELPVRIWSPAAKFVHMLGGDPSNNKFHRLFFRPRGRRLYVSNFIAPSASPLAGFGPVFLSTVELPRGSRRAPPNPSIERTSKSSLRELSAAAHVERWASQPERRLSRRVALAMLHA
jgi:hypothetical protein